MPIVKANAYGHGVGEVVRTIHGLTVWGVGVADGQEALTLRRNGYRGRILTLSSWLLTDLPALVRANVDLVVFDEVSWKAVAALPPTLRRRARVHLKLDTGTTRIGFTANDIPRLARLVASAPFSIVGVFSHFANAEEASVARTNAQVKRFTTLKERLPLPRGIVSHIACTAAGIRYPEARFGLLRLGIGLYGLWPSAPIRRFQGQKTGGLRLRPVLAWKTRLLQVKRVPTGTAIGYGSTVVTKRPTTIGILPIGYADGYDRRFSNRAWVMVGGKRASVVGRVCMNLTMVDLGPGTSARVGQEVTLVGPGCSADDLAALAATISYEVVTRINWTITRRLV